MFNESVYDFYRFASNTEIFVATNWGMEAFATQEIFKMTAYLRKLAKGHYLVAARECKRNIQKRLDNPPVL